LLEELTAVNGDVAFGGSGERKVVKICLEN
jgi:hypothetical protein